MEAVFFAQSYAEARQKFIAAAEAAGLDVHAHVHPLLGRDGEQLALDVARHGPPDADKLLIISSGCHGVEGYAGSGIQGALLADAAWNEAVRRAGVAMLYLHALNPYGFSWLRRVTQEGVDLNRNFVDFHAPLPRNDGYDEIAAALLPRHWPPSDANEARLKAYAERHDARAYQTAVSAGQYAHEGGLFYGGRAPTWSRLTLQHVLEDHGRRAARIGWIDLHTGLGPSGHGERIFASHDDEIDLNRTRAWWGPEVTSIYDGSSTSALLQGEMWNVMFAVCAQAEYTGIALEFGTLPVEQMIEALRAEHWLELHPEAPAEQAKAIKRQIRDAFYVDTPQWKRQLVEQGRQAAHQGLAGLLG